MNPAVTPIHVPFTAGMREDVDSKLLPQGVFARLQNARYRKDGRLGLRNGYAALSMSAPGSGTVVPYDVFSYRDRLHLLGDDSGRGAPTDVWTLTEMSGRTWQQSGAGATVNQQVMLNPFTRIREIPTAAQAETAASDNYAMASCDGFVMTVYRGANADTLFVQVIKETTGETVLTHRMDGSLATAGSVPKICTPLASSSGSARCFILTVRNGTSNVTLTAFRFDPASDTALTSIDTETEATSIGAYALAEVSGLDQYVTAVYRASGDILIKRFDTSGTQQGSTITLSSTTPTQLDIEASDVDDTINLAHLQGNTLTLYTYGFDAVLDDSTSISTAVLSNTAVFIARYPANAGSSMPESVVLAFQTAGDSGSPHDTGLRYRQISDHSNEGTGTVKDFAVRARPIPAPGASSTTDSGVILVGTIPAGTTESAEPTNALIYCDQIVQHSTTLDPLIAVAAPQQLVRDASTGRYLWGRRSLDVLGNVQFRLASFQAFSSARRPIAEKGGSIFIGGGSLLQFDGVQVGEVGFGEVPSIRSLASSNGAGALTNSGQYDYVITWSYIDGNKEVMLSAPSNPDSITLGASDDTVTLVCSTPHMMRQAVAYYWLGAGITVTAWRTVWDGTAKVTGFRRAASVNLDHVQSNEAGAVVSLVDTKSDADLADEPLLYTDAGSGALSGTLPRVAPLPSMLVTATSEGLMLAGQPNDTAFQLSLPTASGEALSFVPNALTGVAFFGAAPTGIEAIAVVDGLRVFLGRHGISISGGPAPDAEGRNEVERPTSIPTNFGLRDDTAWESVLLTAEGLWFQADDDKLCLLPRGASSPEWAGQAVRSTLTAFPDIVGASLAANDNVAAWAANSETEGRLVLRDQRTGDWIVDVLPDEDLLRGLTQHQGKIVYITTDGVRRQADDFDDGTGELIPLLAETGDATAFGVNGWGKIVCCTLLAEYRGNCTIRGSISYDSGATYSTIKEFDLEDLTVGSTQELQFWPRRRKCSRFRFKFEVVDIDGPSEGAVLHGVTFHARGTRAATKKARASRG